MTRTTARTKKIRATFRAIDTAGGATPMIGFSSRDTTSAVRASATWATTKAAASTTGKPPDVDATVGASPPLGRRRQVRSMKTFFVSV